MGAKLGGSDDEPIAEINIVPFVDIILVVLIIFMVTTPVLMKPSINVNLPKAASGDETAPTLLSISISAGGETRLNGNPATPEEIGTFAAEAVKTQPDIQAVISADKDVSHGRVVSIIDVIKSVGVRKFAISIDKK